MKVKKVSSWIYTKAVAILIQFLSRSYLGTLKPKYLELIRDQNIFLTIII